MKEYLQGRKNIFPASDWFDSNFIGGFLNSTSESKKFLNEQVYKIGEENLSSRVLNHWYDSGILKDDRPNGRGWKKFSISELIWIQIIMKLRGFGLDLARIRKVKAEIDLYNSQDKASKCPLLDFHIILAMKAKSPVKLLVFESGEASINRQIEIDMANQLDMITEDYIAIDLNKLVKKFFKRKKFKTDYLSYSDIPKSELIQEVENSLRAEDIQSITIKIKGEKYGFNEAFLTTNRNKAIEMMNMQKFGQLIEIKNSEKSTFQITKKKKIKRDNP